eukprot:14480073-Alexandrium_andersonii.AAC.1
MQGKSLPPGLAVKLQNACRFCCDQSAQVPGPRSFLVASRWHGVGGGGEQRARCPKGPGADLCTAQGASGQMCTA